MAEGVRTWHDGDEYYGEWKDDELSGRGVLTWAHAWPQVRRRV
jgi:hypothetical protein